MKRHFLEWRSCRPVGGAALESPIPRSLFAASPAELPDRLPVEVALLLPIQTPGDPVPAQVDAPEEVAAGLFLANPLLNVVRWSSVFAQRGIGWVSNFPSVTQHEQGFQDGLSDVNLGPGKERALLAAFRAEGFRTLVCVSGPEDARAATQDGCDALLVLPQVPAFLGGFPSVQQRERQLAEIRGALGAVRVPMLGLLQPAEANLPATWPRGMDAGLIRPKGPSS